MQSSQIGCNLIRQKMCSVKWVAPTSSFLVSYRWVKTNLFVSCPKVSTTQTCQERISWHDIRNNNVDTSTRWLVRCINYNRMLLMPAIYSSISYCILIDASPFCKKVAVKLLFLLNAVAVLVSKQYPSFVWSILKTSRSKCVPLCLSFVHLK